MLKAFVYAVIFLVIAVVLATRRIGWGNWQFAVINGLVIVAALAGRWL